MARPDYTHKYVNSERVALSDAEIDECVARETAWTAAAPAMAFAALRSERDQKLRDTDWMSLPDSPAMSDAWTQYRADLRALPAQYDDETILGTITFPTPPS